MKSEIQRNINNDDINNLIWSNKKNRFYNKKKKRITLNIHQDTYEFIQCYLDESEYNITELIRNIIEDWKEWMERELNI